MPSSSKRKGNGFERELVKYFEGRGMEAKRAYASNGEALGQGAACDLLAHTPYHPLPIQAKRRKKLPAYILPPEGVPYVVLREDRGPAYILMSLDTYLTDLDHAAQVGRHRSLRTDSEGGG